MNPATVVTCKTVDDTDCLKRTCDPKTSACNLTAVKNGSACDDGAKCTVGDVCIAGSCSAGKNTCTCKVDADCKSEDDGNICNGIFFCNLATKGCEHNPATAIKCQTVLDTPCRKASCVPLSGACTMVDSPKGALCNDGDKCTANDPCDGNGNCLPGLQICPCKTAADCVGKDDGNLCNGTWYCDKAGGKPECKYNPGSVVYCKQDAGDVGLKKACNPGSGACVLKPANDKGSCDDGSACTDKDTCKGGSCGGQPTDCDDKNLCTSDSCHPAKGCIHKKKACSDGNQCTLDTCAPKTGQCAFTAVDGNSCNGDNNGCTVNDICKNKVCVTGLKADCQIKTAPCESPLCKSTGLNAHSCVKIPKKDGANCDDTKSCNAGATCLKGACKPGTESKLFTAMFGETGKRNAVSAVWVDGATLWLAGPTHAGFASGPVTASGWTLRRVGPTGKQLGATYFAGQAAFAGTSVVGMVGAQDSVTLVGLARTKDGKNQPRLVRVAKATMKASVDKYLDVATGMVPRGVTSLPGSSLVMVGETAGSGSLGLQAMGVRVSTSGAVAWANKWGKAGPDTAMAAVSTAAGALYVAGATGSASGSDGSLRFVDGAGNLKWERTYRPGDKLSGVLTAVQQHPDGGIVAGGRFDALTGGKTRRRWWLLKTDAAGKSLWSRTSVAGGFELRGLGLDKDGRILAVGAMGALNKGSFDAKEGWILAADNLGNRRWEKTMSSGAPTALAALRVTGEGGLVGGGWATNTKANGRADGYVVRLDPWGHASCKTSAGCHGVTPKACDDNNPCTVDQCAPGGGCKHLKAEGLLCGTDDGCIKERRCTQGKCTPFGQQRLWLKAYDDAILGSNRSFIRSAAAGVINGDRVAVGVVKTTTSSTAYYYYYWGAGHFTGEGALMAVDVSTYIGRRNLSKLPQYVAARGAVITSTGRTVVYGELQRQGHKYVQLRFLGVDAKLKPGAIGSYVHTNSYNYATDAVPRPGGGVLVIARRKLQYNDSGQSMRVFLSVAYKSWCKARRA